MIVVELTAVEFTTFEFTAAAGSTNAAELTDTAVSTNAAAEFTAETTVSPRAAVFSVHLPLWLLSGGRRHSSHSSRPH